MAKKEGEKIFQKEGAASTVYSPESDSTMGTSCTQGPALTVSSLSRLGDSNFYEHSAPFPERVTHPVISPCVSLCLYLCGCLKRLFHAKGGKGAQASIYAHMDEYIL